jgi:hypothetical protein
VPSSGFLSGQIKKEARTPKLSAIVTLNHKNTIPRALNLIAAQMKNNPTSNT